MVGIQRVRGKKTDGKYISYCDYWQICAGFTCGFIELLRIGAVAAHKFLSKNNVILQMESSVGRLNKKAFK